MTASIKLNRVFILGVSGGSGSGKTYFAEALQGLIGPEQCDIICQDNYYHDQSKKFDYDGGSVNFDHPNSIDFDLLAAHAQSLKTGLSVEIPLYDFHSHSRKNQTKTVNPKKLIIIDGILIFHPTKLRQVFDDLIFFETPEDIRFSRRLERDTKQRGRTAEGVKNQFDSQVKPMHDLFVEPSKYFAKSIVKSEADFARLLLFMEKLLS